MTVGIVTANPMKIDVNVIFYKCKPPVASSTVRDTCRTQGLAGPGLAANGNNTKKGSTNAIATIDSSAIPRRHPFLQRLVMDKSPQLGPESPVPNRQCGSIARPEQPDARRMDSTPSAATVTRKSHATPAKILTVATRPALASDALSHTLAAARGRI